MDPDFGRWTIAVSNNQQQQIGRSEFGTVFKARTDRNQTVAVKIVSIESAKDPKLCQEIIQQERNVFDNLKKVRHPNVVLFLKFDSDASQVQIFTELIAGDSLSELMIERQRPFEEPHVREFALQVCSALDFLHSRKPVVLHRYIKCSNIMLTHEGVIKLIDFGFAKEIARVVTLPEADFPEGCLYFKAPEMFIDDEGQVVPKPSVNKCTTKTDVWAVGFTIFEMLNMRSPYCNVTRDELPQTVVDGEIPKLTSPSGVSDALKEFYDLCVARKPENRADISQLLQHQFFKRSSPESDSTTLDENFICWTFLFNDSGEKELVGVGEFSKVYKALTDRHQTVAVKVRKNYQTASQHVEALKSGYEILKKIRHRNILLFLKCEQTARRGFCVFTELIAGHSLSELMNRQRRGFDEAGVRKFCQQICSALHYLHTRKPIILHRNINCSNIMLTDQGDIKLISFSNALECPQQGCAQRDSLKTSWNFMAPELFNEDSNVVFTPKTDVWAFGCAVFEMLTTKPPNWQLIKEHIPLKIKTSGMPQLPSGTSDILTKFYQECVVKEPEKRPDTAELLRHRFLLNSDQEALDPDFRSWKIALDSKGQKKFLGRGAFGDVYEAVTDRGQTVAVKIIRLQGGTTLDETIERESAEISILKSIRHPNIVLFLKSERTTRDNSFCIFTELIAGKTLSEQMRSQNRPFNEPEVQSISFQICSVLNFMHSRRPSILHRDIKCSNIMRTEEGTIKLIDFGLAREIITTSGGHNSENPSGTWHFMAPEILKAEENFVYTKKTDVWAFGCTVYEMLAMKPPNDNLLCTQIPMHVAKHKLPNLPTSASNNLQEFYRQCVKRNPNKRADTAKLLEHSFLTSNRDTLSSNFSSWTFIFDNNGDRQLVGQGEFGRVFKALTDLHQTVAVKVIKNSESVNIESWESTVETVKSGHEVLQSVRHKNILLFLKSELTAEHGFCIVTELISGHSLSGLMTRQKTPFKEPAVTRFSRQICSALDYLHSREPTVLHRNIKGSNIMLTGQGEIKLIGFGLAVVCSGAEFKDDSPRGTWHFMAPQLFSAPVDEVVYSTKTDVWAFGCTVYEMLAMKPPNSETEAHFLPMKVAELDLPNLPEEASERLSEFYRRCVARNPEERADFAELLRHPFLKQN